MLRIRKVADGTTAANRSAIEAAQKIMREQFPAMPAYDIDKLPEQLANPLKHRFVTRLFVVPNPSPANAHFTVLDQRRWYDRLERWRALEREAIAADRRADPHAQKVWGRSFSRVAKEAQRRKGRS